MSKMRIRTASLMILVLVLLQSIGLAATDVTFFATSDSHYTLDKFPNRCQNNLATLQQMNDMPGQPWPEKLGGDAIAKPRGVVVLGDIIDDGDRRDQSSKQWDAFVKQFGLTGSDGPLRYPVFEGWGNHDGPPEGKEKNGFSMQKQLKARNQLRMKSGAISNLSENGLHYSWDWSGVHFVQLNIYPADKQNAGVRYSAVWHDPQFSLSFLTADLKKNVGASGRPVVLMSHCGFDTDWWSKEDWATYYKAVKDYNVILHLYGHSGTGVGRWKPQDETKYINTINTGQTEKGFFVVNITDNRLRAAYRIKNFVNKTPDGTWTWKYPLDRPISVPATQPSKP